MFLFSLFYVIREFHRFLHRGKAANLLNVDTGSLKKLRKATQCQPQSTTVGRVEAKAIFLKKVWKPDPFPPLGMN